jgi:uncharacterized membrane protein
MDPLVRCLLLGASSGVRTFSGPLVLGLRGADGLSGPLGARGARALLGVAAVGEMVADKLPGVPDRIRSGALLGRTVAGAVCGGMLAHGLGAPAVRGALLGGAGAVAGAHLGFAARRALTQRVGLPDWPVALGEDLLCLALARWAVAGPDPTGRSA